MKVSEFMQLGGGNELSPHNLNIITVIRHTFESYWGYLLQAFLFTVTMVPHNKSHGDLILGTKAYFVAAH